jgi:hypothetical protein
MSEQMAAPSKSRTIPLLGTLIVVAITLVMLFALPLFAAPASAAPAANGLQPAVTPASSSAVQTWAFGGTKTISGDFTVTSSTGNGFELQYHAFFGWTVVFTQTNNSTNTGFQIEAQRTAAAKLWVNLCTPNCASANWTGNYTATASEVSTAFGNFTREGTVYVGGTPTAALGFLNGSGSTQNALHSKLTVTGTLGHVSVWYFNVTGSAQAQVFFNPELGLIPYNLFAGEHWNSTAAFSLSGAYALSWQFVGPISQSSGNPSGTFSANGTVELMGTFATDISLNNHEHTHVLLIGLTGPLGVPFDLLDGVIVLPHEGNVFGGDASALTPGSSMGGLGFVPAASTSAVDYDSATAHFGLAAAATTFGPTASGIGPSPALSPAATSPSGGDIQAQPMSVSAAQACAASLNSGGTCATAPGGYYQLGPFRVTQLEVIALGVGVVALVAVLAVAVGRRPRTPPPVRVPAPTTRVPPGASGQLAPPPRAPPQQPSDPLGNLW